VPARPSTKPVLVNFYEKVTDRLLTTAAADHGDRLLAKVRLADVIDVDHLTGRAKSYGLSSHLDFVMVRADTSEPRFAVELDGAQHWTDPAVRERDRLKDDLCELAQLPLLRVTSAFTHQKGRWTVLTYLVDAFYLAEAFYEAQVSGSIPWDEPFDAGSFITTDEDGQRGFNMLDAVARRRLWALHEHGELPAALPDTWVTSSDAEGAVCAHAFLAVATDRYLISRVRVRDFNFPGVGPGELAMQLAVLDIEQQATRWLAGEAVASHGRDLAKAMAEVQRHLDAGGFRSSATGGGLAPGGPPPSTITVRLGGVREST
jgi:hypothetical protein